MKRFTKKQITITAVQYKYPASKKIKMWLGKSLGDQKMQRHPGAIGELEILTLEDGHDGRVAHVATSGDWIIQGVKGEFYPCKPDIFEMTYDVAGVEPENEIDQNSVGGWVAPENMNFGSALECLKAGFKVARSGWNGKGMWVALTPASSFSSDYAKTGHAAGHRANEMSKTHQEYIYLNAHIDMKTADGSMCIGWLASQTDMLADDWCIVD